MSHPLERIVQHAGRLDILCCLIDGKPLTVSQLSARIGKTPTETGHHVGVLAAHDLVAKEGESGEERPLHAVELDDYPDWVRKAVEDHRHCD